VDANHFYWTLTPQSGPSDGQLERTALGDGTTETVATLPGREDGSPASLWQASSETLFMRPGTKGYTYAVSLAGGAMRTLMAPPAPSGASLYALGVNNGGVLWSIETSASAPLGAKAVLGFSDLADAPGAAAHPFWTSKPTGFRPAGGGTFADGDRGWIVTGSEALADGSHHVSVWSVDEAGNGRRLGCGPALPTFDDFGTGVTAAVTSDAIYVVVENDVDPPEVHFHYALVRFDRK
jgi:hypothetical protein